MVNKIINRFNIQRIVVFIFLTVQVSDLGAQTPVVIRNFHVYEQIAKQDTNNVMTELRSVIPEIKYDLRYATVNNFMRRKLYPLGNIAFLRLPVARALAAVQADLDQKGFALKIWDAYRPYSVTKAMWEPIKDERYVADPKKGSGHNRGIAVDLTLIDKLSGNELDMGTGFDNFSDTAHRDFSALPMQVLENRLFLQTTMEKHGFVALPTEWWHFYWHDSNFDLMDIAPKKFKKNIN